MSDTTGGLPTLRALLAGLGATDEELDRAEAAGTVGLLAVERLVLPDPPRYDAAEVTAAAGLPEETGRRFWRALGFPDTRPGERFFTDADVEVLRLVASLLDLGVIEPDLAIQLTRVLGSSLARVAEAQVGAIEERLPARAADVTDDPGVLRADDLLPLMPRIMDYVWRRHVQAAARRRLVRHVDGGAGAGAAAGRAVGFADLVGFTAMSQQVTEHELASVVDRFEAVAYDTVAALGGRVVKMIGDEVMFVVDDTAAAADIALALAESYHDDESIPDVRVGLASGPVLERDGDVYGPVVNLASRIVGIAYPGSVVVAADVRAALGDDPRFAWRPLRPRVLRDIGRVELWRVRSVGVDESTGAGVRGAAVGEPRWLRVADLRAELRRRVAGRLAEQVGEAAARAEDVAGRAERLAERVDRLAGRLGDAEDS